VTPTVPRSSIFLVGFMGAGKTSVGRRVAARLGAAFADTDELVVEREGRPIERIFEESGEGYFRRVEWEALEALGGRSELVVATGGGLFLGLVARRWLREHGVTAWLDVPFAECLRRLGSGPARPLFHRVREPAEQRALYERRRATYALADVRVPGLGPEDEVAARLLGRLGLEVP